MSKTSIFPISIGQFACFGVPISYLEIQKKQIGNIEVLDISHQSHKKKHTAQQCAIEEGNERQVTDCDDGFYVILAFHAFL